ncbi:hypothetical protein FOZ63_030649 [Perkinsus olseni]|uniref:Uncharacterized protein n=2 Tax=Perkinsus olseni TaxID=32597 RepID=A0A7J6UF22_PEROL|nr:hypothetical protein FOZ63_030649 [Perkinsus olseni]
MHLERHLGFLPMGKYTKKFTPKSELYAGAGARSWSQEASLLCGFYLSRPDVGQAFSLTGVFAKLSTAKDGYGRGTIKPRLNVSRLYDLLSNAKEAAPKPGHQVRGNMMALDIWPASFGDSVTKDGLILVDLLHWLMRGSMKYDD